MIANGAYLPRASLSERGRRPIGRTLGGHGGLGPVKRGRAIAVNLRATFDLLRSPGEDAEARHRRETLITTFCGFAVFGLAFITGPILAQALGASGRGSVAAVVVPTQILGWLLMFGIPQASAYFARDHSARKLTMSGWVFTALVGPPVVAVLWVLAPGWLTEHPPLVTNYFRIYLLAALLVLPFTNTIDFLRGAGRILAFNLFRTMQYGLNTVFLVVLFALGQLTLERALVSTLVANVTAWVVTLVVNDGLPGRGFDRKVFLSQIHYGSRVWVGTLSSMVIARFDQLLMIGLVARAELGVYVVAATAAQVTGPIGQGVALTLLPHLRADGDDGDEGRHRRLTRTALGWTLAGSGGTALLVALAAPFALPFVYGQEFRAAVPPLLILLVGQVCLDLGNVVGSKLEADNRPGTLSTGTALGAGLTVALVVPAVRLFGIEGAAAVTSASQMLFLAYVLWADRRPATDHGEPRR